MANSAYRVNDGGSDSANCSDEPLEREGTRSVVVMGATTCLMSAFTNISMPVWPDENSKSQSMLVNPPSRPLGLWDSWDKTTLNFRLRLPSWLLARQPQMGPLPHHSILTLLTWCLLITELVNIFAPAVFTLTFPMQQGTRFGGCMDTIAGPELTMASLQRGLLSMYLPITGATTDPFQCVATNDFN